MRNKVKIIGEAIWVFSPVIILFLACVSYFYNGDTKTDDVNSKVRNEYRVTGSDLENKQMYLPGNVKTH